ncbi:MULTISPECIES: type 1 glutamine amidotransferase [unclassified Pseudoclavibacter]|uniref:type 1 glutamine amidotransferase n=1 Tax=unclassified Pseudoclavibacter TaxID=2615177 RepID=UPI000CE92F99|nr:MULTISPECIES: cobyric acid synthase [unclassified Pseudoclavibacter]MBS3177876.1 cobyric acid synthase [Pseudoclavibacter sp. Marseille-Q4354]PPG29446.1 cobyric acid synthase [Pseudoclavibacter sp. RFBB5]
MKLRIAHLYPVELGINGDVGNVTVLAKRARARGLEVEVVNVGRGTASLPERIDVLHVGSGPLAAVQTVQADALRHAAELRDLVGAGLPLLAVGGGWELLGTSITHDDGELEGLGVFASRAVREASQSVAETVVRGDGGLLAGFANHNAITALGAGAEPLGEIVRGFGNGGSAAENTGAEGIRHLAAMGTHLHGPVLALNPSLADQLLERAVHRHDADRSLGDGGEELARLDLWSQNARLALMRRIGVAAPAS